MHKTTYSLSLGVDKQFEAQRVWPMISSLMAFWFGRWENDIQVEKDFPRNPHTRTKLALTKVTYIFYYRLCTINRGSTKRIGGWPWRTQRSTRVWGRSIVCYVQSTTPRGRSTIALWPSTTPFKAIDWGMRC